MNDVSEPEAKLYFESGRLFARRPYFVWLTAAFALLLTYSILYAGTRRLLFLASALPLVVGTALVPFAMKFGYESLIRWGGQLERFVERDSATLREWFDAEMKRVFDRRPIEGLGIAVMAVALVAYLLGGAFQGLSVWEIVAIGSLIALAGFMGGVAIYCALFFGRVVFRVGQFPVRVDPHRFGVMSTGTMLRACYVVAALIWFVMSLSATWGLKRGSIPLFVMAAPSLVVVVGSFVCCQVPLHWRMVEYKRRKLFEVEATLSRLLPSHDIPIDAERKQEVEFLERRIERILALPEWPFGWKLFVSVLASSLLSAGPALVQLLLGAVFQRVGF